MVHFLSVFLLSSVKSRFLPEFGVKTLGLKNVDLMNPVPILIGHHTPSSSPL